MADESRSAGWWLGSDGPFAEAFEGFRVRSQQQCMADAVEKAIAERGELIAEAGTGTGKTFAYLVPALLSGRRIIVSTGTKNLQDQLFDRDLPLVRKVLKRGVSTALLKGRANYLCRYRLATANAEGRFQSREQVRYLRMINAWSMQTRFGDRAEAAQVPDDAPIWRTVTSTSDNCLGQECPELDQCFLLKARREALKADVVVINHHLLFADIALRDEGFGELLPGADALIVDEAHQLHRVAQQFFGTTLSSRQVFELVRDAEAEQLAEAGEMSELRDCYQQLEKAAQDFRLALGRADQRAGWPQIARREAVAAAADRLRQTLAELGESFTAVGERSKGLEAIGRRAEAFALQLQGFLEEGDESRICWFETRQTGFWLNTTPLAVGELFKRCRAHYAAAWIFTSATLTIEEGFAHFQNQLGLEEADTACYESPFDYANQARLFLPRRLPDPNDPGYSRAMLEAAMPLINNSPGGVFLLFTSYRALSEAASYLSERTSRPIYAQGHGSRSSLLEAFRESGNAILLGTASFWEGVDVRGEALTCVIIDRLPFASPSDPVLQAQVTASRKAGGNPFMEIQLPQAVIALKQGVGRLIRDFEDRGVIMLCDPRLRQKSYGSVFLRSLPPMPVCHEAEEVVRFWAEPHSLPDALPEAVDQ